MGLPDGTIPAYERKETKEYHDEDGKKQTKEVLVTYWGSDAEKKRREDHAVYSFSEKVTGYVVIAFCIFLIALILGFL